MSRKLGVVQHAPRSRAILIQASFVCPPPQQQAHSCSHGIRITARTNLVQRCGLRAFTRLVCPVLQQVGHNFAFGQPCSTEQPQGPLLNAGASLVERHPRGRCGLNCAKSKFTSRPLDRRLPPVLRIVSMIRTRPFSAVGLTSDVCVAANGRVAPASIRVFTIGQYAPKAAKRSAHD